MAKDMMHWNIIHPSTYKNPTAALIQIPVPQAKEVTKSLPKWKELLLTAGMEKQTVESKIFFLAATVQ